MKKYDVVILAGGKGLRIRNYLDNNPKPLAKINNLYYGWIIVIVMSISTAATMGMGSLNFGLFINPMGSELNIGRSTFGLAQTFRQFSSSITAPIVGRLIDKYGSRGLLPFAAFIVGICLIFWFSKSSINMSN